MANNVEIEAYERLIEAVCVFINRNEQIQDDLNDNARHLCMAMANDAPSIVLAARFREITKKMDEVNIKANRLKRGLENTRDALLELRAQENE